MLRTRPARSASSLIPLPTPLVDRSFAFSNWTSFTPLSESFMPHHRVHIIELSPEIQSATISSKISTLRVDTANRAVKSRAIVWQRKRTFVLFDSREKRICASFARVISYEEKKKRNRKDRFKVERKKEKKNRETNRENYRSGPAGGDDPRIA